MLMKKKIYRVAFFALLFTGFFSASHAQNYVTVKPTVKIAARPACPHPGYLWVSGDWKWQGNKYVWHNGYWAAPPKKGAMWYPGHWKKDNKGYYWIPGKWQNEK